jgi:hypothetical protein
MLMLMCIYIVPRQSPCQQQPLRLCRGGVDIGALVLTQGMSLANGIVGGRRSRSAATRRSRHPWPNRWRG